MTDRPAFVLLEDGTWYPGTSLRPLEAAFGEVVFTTNLSGYQEVFTDPSCLGQIVVMTAPMIGNCGINPEDMESSSPQLAGVVVREMARRPSSWRSTSSLDRWLAESRVPVLEHTDTRRLTRHIRERGAMRGVIAEGREPSPSLTLRLMESPAMRGLDLVSHATSPRRLVGAGDGPHVVAYDYGIKRSIVRMLEAAGCRVTVVPATTPAGELQEIQPDGLLLSSGPGDPAAVGYAVRSIRELTAAGLPTFGIGLGHQLLALAFGGRTVKLPYGHRGSHHPVRDLVTGQVLMTTQNHGFAVQGDGAAIPGAAGLEVSHINLNDGTVEGLRHKELPVFAVQYQPEASPGPHDTYRHFQEFVRLLHARTPSGGPTP